MPQLAENINFNDCNSFIFAPNYYELVQCLSSKAAGEALQNLGSGGVA